ILRVEHYQIQPGITRVSPFAFDFYPYSHSLLAAVLWGIGFGAVYYARRRNLAGAIVLGLAVLSHWVLDLIVHRPDLPLGVTGSTRLGLGLWNSVPGTILVEGAIFVAGVALYLWATRAKDRRGRWGLWTLLAFLVITYASQFAGTPPPSNPVALGVFSLVLEGILVVWGYWVDAHRESAPGPV
ncbi:MAG TPA: hypothetical protein VL359_12605, partial [bacterium]|nr:hypothetical protein [bacterium]